MCVCLCVNIMCVWFPCACNALDLLSRIDVSYSSCVVVGGTAVTVSISDYIVVVVTVKQIDKLIY
jgi:hypothetical protein